MALAIYNGCRDVLPDCQEGYIKTIIADMVRDLGIIEGPIAGFDNIAIPDNMVLELTQLVVDRLLNAGYPVEVQPVVAEEHAYIDESYRDDSIDLLCNEFKWFYRQSIMRVYDRSKSYTQARQILQNIVKPYLPTHFNLESVDPSHPSYPVIRIRRHFTPDNSISHQEHGSFRLLQIPRAVRQVVVRSTKLQAEIEAIKKTFEKKDKEVAETVNFEEYENEAMLISCQCCYNDCAFESLVACAEGHLFCQSCLIEYVKVQTEVGVKKGYLECMEGSCDAQFPESLLKVRLDPECLKKLDERIAQFNINTCGMSDVVRCPKCQVQFQIDETTKVLLCVSCNHASCRRCQEPWDKDHIGKSCEEVEGNCETRTRRLYEEEMTKALVRTCSRCRTDIMKTEGCNKMTCTCGATQCYVCRMSNINYDHFCQHVRDPGKSCTKCSKCSLWIDSKKDDEVKLQNLENEAKKKQEAEQAARVQKIRELDKMKEMSQPSTSGCYKRPLSSVESGSNVTPKLAKLC